MIFVMTFASAVDEISKTVPRNATAMTFDESVVTKTCVPKTDVITVMSRACPSWAQSGQVEHTEAVGHEFSAAAL